MEYCKTSTKEKEVLQVFEDYIAHNYNSANVMLLTKQGGYSCYAGNPNSLVITPDLKVRKCTVALNDPINIVGFIDKNGIYQKNENLDLWIKDYSDKYCNTCIAQKTCQGSSCPLANIKANKKICPPIKQEINVLTQQVVKFYDKFN
ncbi:SPASM domain-containing protein [Haemophilus parahaemolyticus]|uniref:SPASM domain-containing protein n=1 Tax=Haemophilus parahaemolyticus TaxID=735 RepID=UPI0028D24886|nr:SPASM domain-containing protein [Haemophilus parahaemolyticus]